MASSEDRLATVGSTLSMSVSGACMPVVFTVRWGRFQEVR